MFEIAIKSYFSEQILKIILYEVVLNTEVHVSYTKTYLIWHNRVFYHTFYLKLPIFLHRYICHICDILQLCGGWRWEILQMLENKIPPP